MTKDEIKRVYLKGYEEGLRQAWNDMIKLATRGYTATEIGIMAKSKLAVLYQTIEAMKKRLQAVDLEEEKEAEVLKAEIPLKEKGSYIVREGRAERIFGIFADLAEGGSKGLCITRIHPGSLVAKHGLDAARFLWLTRTERAVRDKKLEGLSVEFASPTNLVALASTIVQFLEAQSGGAVLLEGIEYLISQNNFGQVLKFVQTVNEQTTLTDSYFLISANPQAMNPQEYELLAKEMNQVL